MLYLNRSLLSVLVAIALAGCSTVAVPVTKTDMEVQAGQDLGKIFAVQEPLTQPISLYEAMARAVRYNLDKRLKLMEESLAQRQFDVSWYDMLPTMVASSGFFGRSNDSGARSLSLLNGNESLQYSTSSEKTHIASSLNMAWNVLDFGITYLGARQQSNRVLVMKEQRRKATQNIIRDVRTAFWRAVAAERILKTMDSLIEGVNKARKDSQNIEVLRDRSPMEALTYQRSLIEALNQLKRERRDLVAARSQLAALMNIAPSQVFELAVPEQGLMVLPKINIAPQIMETMALQIRPELRQELYQGRISADETRRAMLRMLPGLELNYMLSSDSNKYLFNKNWADYSMRLSWNLFNIFSGPTAIKASKAQENVDETRRMALSMAVITQVNVAWLRYQQAVDELATARELGEIEKRIYQHTQTQVANQRYGSSEAILGRVRAEVARMRADRAFVEVQDTAGLIFNTIGINPIADGASMVDLATMADSNRETENRLFAGEIL